MPTLDVSGRDVEVGDEFLRLTPEQQNAAVEEIASKLPSTAGGIAKATGSGLVRGVAGLVGLPAAVAELGAKGISAATGAVGKVLGMDLQRPQGTSAVDFLPTTEGTIKTFEGATGIPLYQPQTRPEKFASTVAEFLPGAALSGGAGTGARAVNLLKYGVVPGVTSEAAGEATAGTPYEAPARVVGGLAGGGAAALATRPTQASRIIRNQLPAGITPQVIDQAEALIRDAAQQGIQLSWPEAISQVAGRPVLTNTMRHLEASPSSEARMAEFFGNRPQQIENAAGPQFGAITPATNQPAAIGPAVGRAAEGAIGDVRDIINRRTDPFYQAAANVRLTPQEMAQVRTLPGYAEARREVMRDPQLRRYIAGLPEDSVGFLNEVKKYLDQQAQNAARPLAQSPNMQRAAGYRSDAATVRQIGINASPEYEVALNTQEQTRRQFLEPLLQGPLGKLADSDITTQRAINALFPTSPLPNSAAEVGTAVSALASRNPWAARQLVRAHMERTFNEATQDLQSGANQAGGAKFRTVIMGNPQQAANLETAVRALPNGDQIWNGINRFMDVLEATGTRQNVGSRTAYNQQFSEQLSASRLGAELAKSATNPLAGLRFLADRYERWQLGQNLDQLAAIFTDPRVGNLLRAIARMPANSPQATQVAARIGLLAESGSVEGRTRPGPNPPTARVTVRPLGGSGLPAVDETIQ